MSLPEKGNLPSTSADSVEAEVFSSSASEAELKAIAKRVRRHIITMTGRAGSGHPGGSLSAVEILTTLYFKVLQHKPLDPQWPDRDRFILSKGHAAPLLYAVLAECGYFPVAELLTLRQMDSCLQGHTDCTVTPGVEMTTGPLGQGRPGRGQQGDGPDDQRREQACGPADATAGRIDGFGAGHRGSQRHRRASSQHRWWTGAARLAADPDWFRSDAGPPT